MTMFPLAQKSGYVGFKKAQITHLLNSCFHSLGIKIRKARDTALDSFRFPQKAVKVFLVLQTLAQPQSSRHPFAPTLVDLSLLWTPAFLVYASTEALPQASLFSS